MDNDWSRTYWVIKNRFSRVEKLIDYSSNLNTSQKDLGINIDIEKIPFDDQKVFELLSQGDTTGIFQLESDGVRSVLKN